MPADPHPRYVLVESFGVPIKLPAVRGGASVVREWLIMDRWYGYAVVWQWRGWPRRRSPGVHGSIRSRRERAESECRRMNAEHDAWLAAG